MQCQEKQANTKRIPRWLAKFILLKTQNNLNNQEKFFTLLEPMTPQEWCYFWIPIIHPGVEIPYDGERNPHGYMKACTATLSALTGYNQKTREILPDASKIAIVSPLVIRERLKKELMAACERCNMEIDNT